MKTLLFSLWAGLLGFVIGYVEGYITGAEVWG